MDEVNEDKKKLHRYLFPDFLGSAMMKVPLNVQLEANLCSMTFMSIGLILTVVYLFLYTNLALWYKIFLVLNGVAGLLFFISNIVTTYQQYQNVMEIKEFNKNIA